MKKLMTMLIVGFVFTLEIMAQNAIVGEGFSTGWGADNTNTDFEYFVSSSGSSYYRLDSADGSSVNKYFRLGIDWNDTKHQVTITIGKDTLVAPGIEYTLNLTNTSSGAMYINVTDTNKRYVFKTFDATATPKGKFIFFELGSAPVSIDSIAYSTNAVAGVGTEVTAMLSGALPTGQSAYIRYSKDDFETSSVLEMTGSGSTYTATIPSDTNTEEATVKFYAFTSGSGLLIPSTKDTVDFYSINQSGTQSEPYLYRVSGSGTTTNHSISINGDLTDWRANERFDNLVTLANGVNGEANLLYMTWDNSNLYFGVDKITTWGSNDNLLFYVDVDGDTANGTNLGFTVNGQTPTLPINYDFGIIVRPGTSNYDDIRSAANKGDDQNKTVFSSFNSGTDVLEFEIPWTAIGTPANGNTIRVFGYMNIDNADNIFTTWPSTGQDISGTTDGGTDFSAGSTPYWFQFAKNTNITPNSQGVLPVELTSFSANVKGTSVVLNWATATEINNYGFEVEKSRDKQVWEKIGFVNGAGNSNTQKQYSFTDAQIGAPKVYYRLKQVDTDGSFEYSQMIEVSSALPKKYALNQNFPNPFNPETKISFALPQAADVTLKVYDVLGNEVATVISGEKMEAGEYSYNFRAGDLASGLYIYTLKANGMVLSKKMTLVK